MNWCSLVPSALLFLSSPSHLSILLSTELFKSGWLTAVVVDVEAAEGAIVGFVVKSSQTIGVASDFFLLWSCFTNVSQLTCDQQEHKSHSMRSMYLWNESCDCCFILSSISSISSISTLSSSNSCCLCFAWTFTWLSSSFHFLKQIAQACGGSPLFQSNSKAQSWHRATSTPRMLLIHHAIIGSQRDGDGVVEPQHTQLMQSTHVQYFAAMPE